MSMMSTFMRELWSIMHISLLRSYEMNRCFPSLAYALFRFHKLTLCSHGLALLVRCKVPDHAG
jgi:hypothetical protein